MSPKRIFCDNSADDSAGPKSRRCVEETWVEAGASPYAAARRGGGKRRLVEVEDEGNLQAPELQSVGLVNHLRGGWYGVLVSATPLATATTEAASTGSSDEDVVDSGGYDADVELGGASSSYSSSSSSASASTCELLTSSDGSGGDSTQLKRRRYVEEIWSEAGASPSAVRRGVVVGGGKRRLVTLDEGDPGRELPVGAVKRFNDGWYGVLVSVRHITTDEAVDSGGYCADAESGTSSSLAEADEEEVEPGRVDIGDR